jgi:hypothetical protein
MKVRCLRLTDSSGEPVTNSAWATIGSVYSVLGIWIERGAARFRILGEEPVPALFEIELFEIVDQSLPRSWVVTSPAPETLSFGPASWARPGFWTDFFDGDRQAVRVFEEECRKMDSDE